MNPAMLLQQQQRARNSKPIKPATASHITTQVMAVMAARRLDSVIQDGAWTGQRCFIIGGGPSLRGFDFSRLKGELVIGINRAYEVIDPAFLATMDSRFIVWASGGKYGQESREQFRSCNATKVLIRNGAATVQPGWHYVNRAGGTWGASITKGLYSGDNSGFGALTLAIALGASPIYLLGYDMQGDGIKQVWWHDGHPTNQNAAVVYKGMRTCFAKYADNINAAVRVINCNPDSALRCFEFGDLPEPRAHRPMVVGYFTAGTGYESEAREMAASVHRMGLECDLRGIPSAGWQKNTQYKAQFMAEMIEKHWGQSIVYTDADSRFVRYPAMFDSLECDFAAHYNTRRTGERELLSGTLFFRCNEAARALAVLWQAECAANPRMWDQQCLQAALARWNGRMAELPREYCCIFDLKPVPVAPVVVHYQASRRLKGEVGP
jgi:hypothetical protein